MGIEWTQDDLAVLAALDMTARCSVIGPAAHPAEVGLKCRGEDCGHVILACKSHARGLAAGIALEAMMAHLQGGIAVLKCKACGRSAESVDELVEVVHLDDH